MGRGVGWGGPPGLLQEHSSACSLLPTPLSLFLPKPLLWLIFWDWPLLGWRCGGDPAVVIQL